MIKSTFFPAQTLDITNLNKVADYVANVLLRKNYESGYEKSTWFQHVRSANFYTSNLDYDAFKTAWMSNLHGILASVAFGSNKPYTKK